MKKTNAQSIGDILQSFYDENPQLKQKILEIRIQRAWGEVLGMMAMQYTRKIYINNGVMNVYINSSVLRNELSLNKERLIKSLNEHVGSVVISDLVIR